jgi:hypothetical protein
MSGPGCRLRSATASATSPLSRVELAHGSGSVRVVEATYFGRPSSTGVNALSRCFGQKPAKSQYVRRPSSRAPVAAMPSPILRPMTGSL